MKNKFKSWKTRKQSGFTLLELLVVIAVIGILASLAVPRFQNQMLKARFVEVVNAAGPYKTAVEICVQRGTALVNCNAASNGIPANTSTASASGVVASVAVAGGVITATGTSVVNNATYILTPTPAAGTSSSGLDWSLNAQGAVSTCLAATLCNPI